MKVQFVNLQRQNQLHKREFTSAINSIVKSASFSLGEPLEKFERNFAKFCSVKYCVSLNSGTDAIEFALRTLGIGKGDEVITAPNSYFSTAATITKVGARPVFADVDSLTHNINPHLIEASITPRTKAIIPVHLFGQPANMDPIIKIAKKHHLKIIEDCAQAHGAKYKGKIVPISGTGAFSFYPSKNLGAFGDGGALVTNSSKVAKLALMLRNDGSLTKYHHQMIGSKSRLDTLQAAILSVKLKYLNKWNQQRRKHARSYNKLLGNITEIILPPQADYSHHVYHLYVIEARRRNQLQKYLAKHGISTVIHYPVPIHRQPAYKSLNFSKGSFPIVEKKAKTILSLPMFPELTPREITYVTDKIINFY